MRASQRRTLEQNRRDARSRQSGQSPIEARALAAFRSVRPRAIPPQTTTAAGGGPGEGVALRRGRRRKPRRERTLAAARHHAAASTAARGGRHARCAPPRAPPTLLAVSLRQPSHSRQRDVGVAERRRKRGGNLRCDVAQRHPLIHQLEYVPIDARVIAERGDERAGAPA